MQVRIETFFWDLGITLESCSVKDDGDDLSVEIRTPDSPLLIGMHGKNLEAFQHILGRIAEKELGRFTHLHLEVNDYMKAKDERLFHFLDSKIAFVTSSGKITRIPNLSPFERKKAHSYISEKKIDGLSTKSEWEGSERALVLSFTGTLIPVSPVISSPRVIHKKDHTLDLALDGVGI